MNGKKAKKLRKVVFGNLDYRERNYVIYKKTGQIVNNAQIEEIKDAGKIKKIPKRRIYQHLKKVTKGIKNKKMEGLIINK